MQTRGSRIEPRRFLVTGLKINRGVPDATFTQPKNLEIGVAIWDETSKERLHVVGESDHDNRHRTDHDNRWFTLGT
jgi:hypothetical protein